MSVQTYLAGWLHLALVLGTAGFSARRWLGDRLATATRTERLLAFGILASAAVIGVHVITLALGVLSPLSVLLASGSLAVGSALLCGRPTSSLLAGEGAARHGAATLAAVAFGAVAVVYGLGHLPVPVDNVDATTFHLPQLAPWMQHGTLWRVDAFLPYLQTSTYPHNGDVLLLAAVLPWRSDFLVRLVAYPYWLMVAASVYAIGMRLRASHDNAVLAALALATMPAVAFYASDGGNTDLPLLAFLGVGALFLLREHASGRRSDLVIAAVALGLAFGTKWNGVTDVPVIVGAWLLARVLARRGDTLRSTTALAGLVALFGGVWIVRNVVVARQLGLPVDVLSLPGLSPPVNPLYSYLHPSVATYWHSPGVWWKYFVRDYWGVLSLSAIAIAFGFLLGLVRRGAPRTAGVMWISGAAIVLGVVYVVTPGTAVGAPGHPTGVGANARYTVPALMLAAAAGASFLSRKDGSRLATFTRVLLWLSVALGPWICWRQPAGLVAPPRSSPPQPS